LLPPGKYRLDSPLDLIGNPAMLVGKQALDGYLGETSGSPIPTSVATSSKLEINAAFLRDLVGKAAGLLGERYERLRASDERAQSSATPRLGDIGLSSLSVMQKKPPVPLTLDGLVSL
jgi:hypothetical protein